MQTTHPRADQAKGFTFRVIERDGEPWFIGKELSDYFDYPKPTKMVRVLDDDEYEVIYSDNVSAGQPENSLFESPRTNLRQSVTLVNEYGLYNLIGRSNKPEAKEFRRWVTHEVLPTIRKTGGGYVEPGRWLSMHSHP